MSTSKRLLPAIALVVVLALSLMAIETSKTLTVEGQPPSERLASALRPFVDPDKDATEHFSNPITLDSR